MLRWVALFLSALIAFHSSAALSKSTLHVVENFDVAGVKLHMTPEEARHALAAKGFSVSDDSMGDSWSAQVSAEAGKYANTPKYYTRAVRYTNAEGPESQKVEVSYEVLEEGSFVKEVRYSLPAERGKFIELVKSKYGRPTRDGLGVWRYCVSPSGCSTSLFSVPPGEETPRLQSGAGFSLRLGQ